MNRDSDEFVTLLTRSQAALYGCILSLLPDRSAARDVLQETNLTLWHKAADFETGTNFLGWAARIARFHILHHRRKLGRDRLVFDDDLFLQLIERQAARVANMSQREEALQECLQKLPPEQRELIQSRYASGGSVQALAAAAGKSVGAISQTLYRIREALLNCIQGSLLTER